METGVTRTWVCPVVPEPPYGTAGMAGLCDPEVRHICQLVTVSGREEPRCHVARNVTTECYQCLLVTSQGRGQQQQVSTVDQDVKEMALSLCHLAPQGSQPRFSRVKKQQTKNFFNCIF